MEGKNNSFLMKSGVSKRQRLLPIKGFVTPEKTIYHAEIFSNRLRKRFVYLSKIFKRERVDCFRLYDWDIKEIRAVVDWYKDQAVIAEYIRRQTPAEWLPAMAKVVAQTLNIPLKNVHMRRRQTKATEGPRYEKLGQHGKRFQVQEKDLYFWVNLEDYLDTGLFSDHRLTRQIVKKIANGKRFLNLFAYTGSFTVAAAKGGAQTTMTVDRSQPYLDWARDNLKLNGLGGAAHSFVKSDISRFVQGALRRGQRFDLCFVDPPSFFRDQGKNISFDINRDHPLLLEDVFKIMEPESTVFFSTNHQRFEPRFEGLKVKSIVELTPKTIPIDYRNRQVHRCWRMTMV